VTGLVPEAEIALDVLVDDATGDARRRLVSPGVGRFVPAQREGARLAPGEALGALEVLGRPHVLRLPTGAAGHLAGVAAPGAAVAYGDVLGWLETGPVPAPEPVGGTASSISTDRASGLAVAAPSSGRYYRRPSPEKPPFVDVGDVVEAGQPVGLLEVMKTFTRVHYGGPGLPERGRVVELVAQDGQEVAEGEALLIVVAADAEVP